MQKKLGWEWELERLLMKKKWELKVNPKLRETVAENKTKIERSWKRAKNFEREEKLEAVWCLQLECNWKEWSCTLPITQLLNLHRSQPSLPCRLKFTWLLNSFRGLAGNTLQYFHYKLHNTTCICCNRSESTDLQGCISNTPWPHRQTDPVISSGWNGTVPKREYIQMPPLDVTLPWAWLFPWQSNQKDSLRLLLLRWKVVNHTAADTHRVVGAGELVKPNDKAPRCTKYAAAISAAELMLIHGCFNCWTDIYHQFQLHGWERIENVRVAFVPAACVVCA